MAELIVEPEAEAELEEAGDRYEESVPGLGLEFLLEMRKRTIELAEAPLSYPVFGGSLQFPAPPPCLLNQLGCSDPRAECAHSRSRV